ncbi:MAG: acyl-CoA synthetase [Betaproteobacteria bacterium RIFCSPLOWO2_02_FULL_67_19]|nr:MAG: acyl-CoA synthetase [Betaproteobacteria bacterium RIFCSPLOWO2_02_FULL_67_19]
MSATHSLVTTLLRQAAAAGRDALDAAELDQLLGGLGFKLAAGAAPADPLRISLLNTREFGLVLFAGVGGADAELDAANFGRDRATVCASVELTDAEDFLDRFRRTLAWQRLAARAKKDGKPVQEAPLKACFEQLLALARAFSASDALVIRSLEFDPVALGAPLSAGAARCEFGPPAPVRLPRPVHKIDKLLHPETIGLIGVSATSMNFGRIILRNIVDSGYPRERLLILRPGEKEIDGVRCVEGLKAFEGKLDLLIVAVAASAVYELVDEIIATDSVNAVMLIPGSLGETKKSREPAAALAERINAAHARPGGGPVFLGANCLGVVSHPGNYDSWFIPLERLPKPQKKPERTSVMLSQSGAFMITRLSQNPWLDPRYMVAVGNQTDLTHGDLLTYFADLPEIETIGLYIEGFRDLDGLEFARATRKAVLAGKQIVIYKSGQTEPGQGGVLGHTASIAGDPKLFESVMRQAGAMVAEDLDDFDALFYIAGALHAKTVGPRLGALSGAGFEAVGMADTIRGDTFSMTMGAPEPGTVARIEAILAAKKLDALVEVRNPLDINPGADDDAHLGIAEAFLEDPNIDAVVVGLDPTAPAVRSLESSKLRPGHDLDDPKSTVQLMPPIVARHAKPFIGVVDGGRLYDAMAARLMDRGVCVFRNVSRATRALVRYTEVRLAAQALKTRFTPDGRPTAEEP